MTTLLERLDLCEFTVSLLDKLATQDNELESLRYESTSLYGKLKKIEQKNSTNRQPLSKNIFDFSWFAGA